MGYFGTGNVSVASTYDMTSGGVTAGGDIVIRAVAAGVSDPRVSLTANTDILGAGHIDVLINGDVSVTETAGDLRIKTIQSNAGDASLTVTAGSLYEVAAGVADPGTTPWVIANTITLSGALRRHWSRG